MSAVRFVDAVDRADVRMVQRRQDLGLAAEARQPFRIVGERIRKDLERHLAAQLGVSRAIHLTHAACAERRDDVVAAEACAGHQSQKGWRVGELYASGGATMFAAFLTRRICGQEPQP